MAKEKVLYKTTYTIEVLTDEEVIYDLEDLPYQISEGDASGGTLKTNTVKVVGKQAVKECEKQGSDPEFFGMDEDGNVIEEDEIDDMLNDRFDDLVDQGY